VLELVVLANSLLEHTREEEILQGLVAVEVKKADTTILIVPIQHSRHPILILLMLLVALKVLILVVALE
jgi:hypothetical protein